MEIAHIFLASMAARIVVISGVLSFVLILEIFIPRERPTWRARSAAVTFWTISITASVLLFTSFRLLWEKLGVAPLLTADGWLPAPLAYAVGPLVGALVGDFFFYWAHRAQHAFFWRFHEIHHSIRSMNGFASYHHWTEELFRIALIVIPSSLIIDTNSGPAFPLTTAFLLVHGIYFHSTAKLHFGPLRYLLVDNRYHRIHHSVDRRHFDQNFSGFTPIWDVAFGTAYFPSPEEWPETGLEDAPAPQGVWDYLFRPFLRRSEGPPEPTNAVSSAKT